MLDRYAIEETLDALKIMRSMKRDLCSTKQGCRRCCLAVPKDETRKKMVCRKDRAIAECIDVFTALREKAGERGEEGKDS